MISQLDSCSGSCCFSLSGSIRQEFRELLDTSAACCVVSPEMSVASRTLSRHCEEQNSLHSLSIHPLKINHLLGSFRNSSVRQLFIAIALLFFPASSRAGKTIS
jgi:hypothetical protein